MKISISIMKGIYMQVEDIIQVNELTKKFGAFYAVNRISFNIRRGEILGFLGPNGAGKTTTIKMINGLLRITSGNVFVKGLNVKKHIKQIKTFTGYMSQKFSLYPLLTSLENIEFFGGISGLSRKQIKKLQQQITDTIPMEILKQKIMDIPPGIKQQVALFTCLMPDPDIIFLDEPTSGVDPKNRRDFWMQIYKLRKAGKTILVTTHNLDEAEYADRIIIIHNGNIIRQGEPSSLLKNENMDSMEDLFKKAVTDDETN